MRRRRKPLSVSLITCLQELTAGQLRLDRDEDQNVAAISFYA